VLDFLFHGAGIGLALTPRGVAFGRNAAVALLPVVQALSTVQAARRSQRVYFDLFHSNHPCMQIKLVFPVCCRCTLTWALGRHRDLRVEFGPSQAAFARADSSNLNFLSRQLISAKTQETGRPHLVHQIYPAAVLLVTKSLRATLWTELCVGLDF